MEITREILKEIISNAIKAASIDISKKIRLNADENSFYFAIGARLAVELDRKNLSMYSVDTNYNRATGIDGNGKGVGIYNEEQRIVEYSGRNQFDIIAHMNGTGDIDCPENLIHIEAKKYNNPQDRDKDIKRLISTTKFPNEISTRSLGLIVNANIFESFYNGFVENDFFAERAKQIRSKWDLIEQSNRKIFEKYTIDYARTDEWFANIIAGYQLGAFIDIGLKEVKITYYYDGAEWESESISIPIKK